MSGKVIGVVTDEPKRYTVNGAVLVQRRLADFTLAETEDVSAVFTELGGVLDPARVSEMTIVALFNDMHRKGTVRKILCMVLRTDDGKQAPALIEALTLSQAAECLADFFQMNFSSMLLQRATSSSTT